VGRQVVRRLRRYMGVHRSMRIATTYPVKKRDDRRVLDMRPTRRARSVAKVKQIQFPARLVTYSAGYEWVRSEVDAATGAWQDDADGLSSSGAGTGTATEAKAEEFSGLADLPDDLIVWMVRTLNDDGSFAYRFTVPHQAEGTEDTIGTTAETEAAQTDTWDIEAQAAKGLVDTRLVRMAYDHTGDKKLYAYYRAYTYDAGGRLLKVSAETRVEIDAPEDC